MRHIAIEITRRSVWLTVGSLKGRRVSLERVLRKEISDPEEVAEALQALTQEAGVRGSKCVAIVRREDVELKVSPFPAESITELPDMVRFSATRLFASAGETWPIDFVTLPQRDERPADAESGPMMTVLAAALSPAVANTMRLAAAKAGLDVQAIYLAPLSLLDYVLENTEVDASPASSFLLLDQLENGAELTVSSSGRPAFLRSVKTGPRTESSDLSPYVSEIKRTSLAAGGGDFPVDFERVIVVGSDASAAAVLTDKLGVQVTAVELERFADLNKLNEDDRKNIALGNWMAAVAAMVNPLARTNMPLDGRQIDFLNTRKVVEKKRAVPLLIGGAAAALVLIAAAAYWNWSSHRKLDQQISQLQREAEDLKPSLDIATSLINSNDQITKFNEQQINWLDELAYLSKNALAADKLILGEIVGSTQPLTNSGLINTNIGVAERSIGPEVERALRDDTHSFEASGWNPVANNSSNYRFVGAAKISIDTGKPTVWMDGLPQSVASEQIDPSATTVETTETAEPSEPKSDEQTETNGAKTTEADTEAADAGQQPGESATEESSTPENPFDVPSTPASVPNDSEETTLEPNAAQEDKA